MAKKAPPDLFADRVHAFTFNSGDPVMVNQRMRLKKAQRFSLDDDAVRLVCNLSHEQKRLMGWAFLARLPYDCVWFEANLHTKVREFAAMKSLQVLTHGKDGGPDLSLVPNVVGYLMFKDGQDPQSQRWMCHMFLEHHGDIYPDMLAYVFDPEGDGRFPTRGSRIWGSPTLSLRPGFPPSPITIAQHDGQHVQTFADPELILVGLYGQKEGTYKARRNDKGEYVTEESVIDGPEWSQGRVAVIVEPWWEAQLKDELADPKRRGRVHTSILTHAAENAGHIRWLVTMLAALNGLPRDVRYVPPKEGRHTIGMNQLPYFGSSVISFTIPRENRLIRAKSVLNKLVSGRHNRWHTFIGHWRIIERGKRQGVCRHSPVMVENNVGICERCGLLVRWINAGERGDASLGVVDHRYDVTT